MSTPLNFLVRGDELHRIDFDGGAWIDIAKYVTQGQRDRWSKAATKSKTRYTFKKEGKRTKREGETYVDFDNEVFTLSMLRDLVKAWSDELPINDENIGKMPEFMSTRVREEFDKLNPQATDDEEDDEVGDSDAGSKPTSDPAEDSFPTNWPS